MKSSVTKRKYLRTFFQKGGLEVGCDEAGRGCLAGPVVAAAVILPQGYSHPLINDSKKLNKEQRNKVKRLIEKKALSFGVGILDHKEIDEHNILRASFLAMHRALDQLQMEPERILVDGNRFIPYKQYEHHCIIKGDAKYTSIAAASILAKTYRDEIMECLHCAHPTYNWKKNKGYPTAEHRQAIIAHGPCQFHRMSFQLYPLPKTGDLFDQSTPHLPC